MRNTSGVAVFSLCALLAACSSQPETTECPQTRPQVCTMEYNPTCAVLNDGSKREYSSPCNACADDNVAEVLVGPCAE